MKRFITVFLLLALLLCAQAAQAANRTRSYTFDLSVNGQHEMRVQKGDIITVVFTLQRTDSATDYTMYAMQNEIRYDDEFVRVIEDASIVSADVRTKDVPMIDGMREFYMNYVSFADGVQWRANQLVGTFQMEILAESGVSKLTNENYKVSVRDGSDVYAAAANDLTLIVSDECTVTFETNGGAPIDPIRVKKNDTLDDLPVPVRGYSVFCGWYKDQAMTDPWYAGVDKVKKRKTTLYAKWL